MLNFETEKKKNKPTNWYEIIDKFLANEKIQKSIFSIVEKFKPKTEETQTQMNIQEIEKNAIYLFLEKITKSGNGKTTIDELYARMKGEKI